MDPFIVYIGGLYNAEAEHKELSLAIGTHNYITAGRSEGKLIVPCILSQLLISHVDEGELEHIIPRHLEKAKLYVEIVSEGFGPSQLRAAQITSHITREKNIERRVYAQQAMTKKNIYNYFAREFLDGNVSTRDVLLYSTPAHLALDFANYLHSEEFKHLLK